MACDTTIAAAAGTVSVLGTSAPFDASVAAATSNSAVAGFGGPAVPFKRRRLPLRRARPSLGQRAADAVARFGGSWTFIFLYGGALLLWIAVNTFVLAYYGRGENGAQFDPYPYILLNLMLSMTAAMQAPIIMMSQNRAAEKDRLAAEQDFKVNLKSELMLEELIRKQRMRDAQMDQLNSALAALEASLKRE